MSFFNITFFNTGTILNRIYETPAPLAYSNIKLFGGGKFGTLYGERRLYSTTDVQSINSKVEQEWLVDTYINAKFNNNLQGGNITSLPSPIDAWIIQRKELNDAKFTVIAEVDDLVDTYDDRLVKSKQTYTYQLIPKAGDTLGTPLEADPVTTNFTTIILLDPNTSEGYSFCLNMQADSISVIDDITESNTKGKYNTLLKGNRRFKRGTVNVIAVSDILDNGALDQDLAFLEQLEGFISNDNEKIIKYPKGMTYRVKTSNMSYNKILGVDANGNTIWAISYDWQEVGEL